MKSAVDVTKRQERFFFDPLSRTIDWVWIGIGHIRSTDSTDKSILGELLLQSLTESKFNIPHPDPVEHRKLMKPLLEAFCVKSWAELVKGSKNVYVNLEDGVLRFEPNKNLGARGGFEPIPGKERLLNLSSVTEAEIGQALLDAFEDAE